MDLETRLLRQGDAYALLNLYLEVASHPSSFARDVDEVTPEYIEDLLERAVEGGVGIAAVDTEDNRLIGFIMATRMTPKAFEHVLSDLIIGVHPDFQSKGIGRRLFLDFLDHVQIERPDILRVELLARESNQRAISFYESVGFRREGSFERRIRRPDGTFETDVPMGWLKRM